MATVSALKSNNFIKDQYSDQVVIIKSLINDLQHIQHVSELSFSNKNTDSILCVSDIMEYII